ncbi:hypothetical protein JL101_030040 (plasmid) [Skermanella rosea]|uniref:hypothetical protein n=1 Tax=Skermanella rosea TaxID=1817965 RepID=UPI001932684E|nr:hypothetical protein [Skermanella rosea]UEM07226.1 hypothetical protein JL101_030040 [Skermanella rosea]
MTGGAVGRVEEYCARAGMRPDSPLRLALLTATRTAEAAREAVGGVRGLTPEGEAELIRRVCEAAAASTAAEAGRIVRRLDLAMVLGAAGLLVACALLAFAGGYWAGRHEAAALGTEISVILRNDANAARTWLPLMRNNDVKAALEKCRGSAVWASNGRNACLVPLWLDGPGAAPKH